LDSDTYIHDVLAEYKQYVTKALRPKRVSMSPCIQCIVLNNEDCPTVPDPRKQRYYRFYIAKFQFAAPWIRYRSLCHRLHVLDKTLSTAEAKYYSASTAATEVLYVGNRLEIRASPEPRHRRTGARQAYRHLEALRAPSDGEWPAEARPRTASQLADILTKPLHFPRWQASST
jgi:hypothetical protein